jgi:pyrroline-5-carboxylate reductase
MVPIGFIGAGNMAEAIIGGIIKKGIFSPQDIMAFDIVKERLDTLSSRFGIRIAPSALDLVQGAESVILAVKPGSIHPVVSSLKGILASRLVISIAAGVTIGSLLEILGEKTRLIRVMPNTPALVLEGVSGLAASKACTPDDKARGLAVFSGIGLCIELEERLLDAVTGLSGSGPAFVFLFIEALSDGGVRAGLPRDVALKLAAATVRGAATMVLETGKHPGGLKDMVASPGGTTIEGLSVLEAKGFRSAVMDAVFAAYKKASNLTK